jgi:hypothetical protein
VLLNESSNFKIAAFENKYGVKVISYTPSDTSHPEVIELLRALNHESGGVVENITPLDTVTIKDPEALVNHLSGAAEDVILGSGFSVFYFGTDVYLSFTPAGETKGEIQKEILSIIKLIKFDCSIISNVNINVIAKTPPLINFDESQAILIKIKVKYDDAKKYAGKEISTTTLWKQLEFYSPEGLSNVFQIEEKTRFPMSTGIVGGEL